MAGIYSEWFKHPTCWLTLTYQSSVLAVIIEWIKWLIHLDSFRFGRYIHYNHYIITYIRFTCSFLCSDILSCWCLCSHRFTCWSLCSHRLSCWCLCFNRSKSWRPNLEMLALAKLVTCRQLSTTIRWVFTCNSICFNVVVDRFLDVYFICVTIIMLTSLQDILQVIWITR